MYAVVCLSHYSAARREGHLSAMMRVFGYLKAYLKGKLIFDTREMSIEEYEFVKPALWTDMYPGAFEEIPEDLPEPLMKPVTINTFFDALLGCDMVTGRSMTGVLLSINRKLLKWYWPCFEKIDDGYQLDIECFSEHEDEYLKHLANTVSNLRFKYIL